MTAAGCQLEDRADGTLAVRGVLTFDTANATWRSLRERLARAPAQVLDLSAVERSDSAGLACVLAVLADAAGQGRSVRVLNAPAGMRTLAQVSGVAPMLA